MISIQHFERIFESQFKIFDKKLFRLKAVSRLLNKNIKNEFSDNLDKLVKSKEDLYSLFKGFNSSSSQACQDYKYFLEHELKKLADVYNEILDEVQEPLKNNL